MPASPDRILRDHTVNCMAGTDTIQHIAQRVRNLLAEGRRITLVERYTHLDTTPDVTAGLTLEEIRPGQQGGIGVDLKPGVRGFGIHAQLGETEAEGWARYHRGDRANLTRVAIIGGLPDSGPSGDDRLIIRHWRSDVVCRETVVAFDHATDIRQELENLAFALGEVQEFVDRYPTLPEELAVKARTLPREQIDVEMMVVERVRDILRRHQAVTSRG